MTKVTLPRTNQTGVNEWADVEANDVALQEKINGNLDNENIASGANIARSKLATEARGVAGKWYTPSVVATEQTRENTAYGTLSTPDEITGVELPSNGLIRIRFAAIVKSSTGGGKVGLFVGSNQVVNSAGENIEPTISTTFGICATAGSSSGMAYTASLPAFGTVQAISAIEVFASAGTYAVSAKFKATSGSITAKERKLWVEVVGF